VNRAIHRLIPQLAICALALALHAGCVSSTPVDVGWGAKHSLAAPSSFRGNYGPPREPQRREPGFDDEDARICDLVSLSWIDARGDLAWTSPVPPRMQPRYAYPCVTTKDYEPHVAQEAPNPFPGYVRGESPIRSSDLKVAGDWIAIPSTSGLLVLDMATGRVLLDWSDPAAPHAPSFAAIRLDWSIDGLLCTKDPGRLDFGGLTGLLTVCDEKLVFFSGRTATIVDLRTWSVLASGGIAERDDWYGTRTVPHLKARIALGPWTLILSGQVPRI
jgi:hypothetical protein